MFGCFSAVQTKTCFDDSDVTSSNWGGCQRAQYCQNFSFKKPVHLVQLENIKMNSFITKKEDEEHFDVFHFSLTVSHQSSSVKHGPALLAFSLSAPVQAVLEMSLNIS